MKEQVLHKELAGYYDLIYARKHYKKEVDIIKKLIRKNKKSRGKELLEVACGTGHHLKYLKSEYKCTGIDLNKEILNVAQKNIKGVKFIKGNMVNFKLNKEFDIVTCLFSSIGYVKTHVNLSKTIRNFSNHLKQGGILIVEPWFSKKQFIPGKPWLDTYDTKDLKIARASISKVRRNLSILSMHYLVAEKNKSVKYYSDKHELGLFDVNQMLGLMKQSGLKSTFVRNGLMKDRGLLIGIKE